MTARLFRPYPAYRDSGVEWLGRIPTSWKVKRLKHLAVLNPEVLTEDTDPTLEIVYVDIGGVDSLGRINERERLTFASAPSRARRLVRDGDVIVSTVRTYLRAIAPIVDPEPGMVVSTGFAVVRPTDELTTEYAAYALRAPYFVERVVANSKGVSFPAINESEMATYEIAAPPEPEQRAIAAFLDRETARIDALVAKKEQLIELLHEQRTALITRAVTEGLDPNVPMKASGVEWLGEIPAHWEVKKATWLFSIGSGTTPQSEDIGYYGGDTPWITTSELRESVILETEKYVTEAALKAHSSLKLHPAGSIAVAMYGATIGRLGVLGIDATVNQACCVFSRPKGIEMEFWFYWLQMRRPYLISLGYGGGQPNLSQELLRSVRVPTPPLSEQAAIAAYLDLETARIDGLIAKVRDAISRLNELRTAHITAAVTGKIDVREEAA